MTLAFRVPPIGQPQPYVIVAALDPATPLSAANALRVRCMQAWLMALASAPPSATSAQLPLELEHQHLRLPWDLRLTPEQFEQVCQANPDAVLELDANGHLLAMTPTGGETSSRYGEILDQMRCFTRRHADWRMFDSSGGFRLPAGSVLSPDASLVAQER